MVKRVGLSNKHVLDIDNCRWNFRDTVTAKRLQSTLRASQMHRKLIWCEHLLSMQIAEK